MRQLKIGVIGTGHMGKNHVRILSEERNQFDCNSWRWDLWGKIKLMESYSQREHLSDG